MKNTTLSVLLVALFCMISPDLLQAQSELPKAERKALKKEIKAYKKAPETFKNMKEKNKQLIENLELENESLKIKLAIEIQKVDSLTSTLAEYEQTIAELENAAVNCGKVPAQGIVYSIQVGNYKKLDLRTTFNANKGLRTENYTGGHAYMIGNFSSSAEANQFVEDIKKLGIKDAFVTQYVDGNRNINYDARKAD